MGCAGLEHTCWVSYADSVTGLDPDGLRMDAEGGERWVDALEKWEEGDRKGHVPGSGEAEDGERRTGVEGGRDYTGEAGYYLRPEVGLRPCPFMKAYSN
jgi:mannosyl-oligosaccharide alpha-1,2-mannosidase